MTTSNTPKVYSYLRFSSPEQAKGDSARRQTSLVEKIAAKLGLPIDEELRDEGISAHRGRHVREGSLGRFFERIKSGDVAPGSMLVVENLDRLSREVPTQAMRQLLALTEAGVSIAVCSDQQIYSEETLANDPNLLTKGLGYMTRAHEESHRKSNLVGEAWQAKRDRARENLEPLTRRTPGWICLVEENGVKRYEVIPERAAIVERIFHESANGLGRHTIARRLNEEDVKPFGRGVAWHPSYIIKILENDAVLGTYHPHKWSPKGRVKDGDPIPKFYPAVISEEIWHRARLALKNRAQVNLKGRTGTKAASPFTNLAVCGSCGHVLTLWHPGVAERKKDGSLGKKLVCTGKRRGLGCPAPFRHDFMQAVQHIFGSLAAFQTAHNSDDVTPRIRHEIEVKKSAIAKADEEQKSLLNLQNFAAMPIANIAEKVTSLQHLMNGLSAEIKDLETSLSTAISAAARIPDRSFLDELLEAYRDLEFDEDSERAYMTRQKTAALARDQIARIVFEAGDHPGQSGGYWVTPKTAIGKPDEANTFFIPVMGGFVWVHEGLYDIFQERSDEVLEELDGDLDDARKAHLRFELASMLAHAPKLRNDRYVRALGNTRYFHRAWIDRHASEREGFQRVGLFKMVIGEPIAA